MAATDSGSDSPGPAQSPQPDGHGRREFMRRVGAGAAGVGAVAVGANQHPQFSPVGRAEAIGPVAIFGAAAAVQTGWMLYEEGVIGSDDPPEGLTPDALHAMVHESALTRVSNNQSTFVDNKNIVESGFSHTLFGDGKLAAIEKLNEQASQQEVQDAATDAADEHATTVIRNLLKSWNEAVHEFENLWNSVDKHEDLSTDDVFPVSDDHGDWNDSEYSISLDYPLLDEDEHTLPNGDTIDVQRWGYDSDWHKDQAYSGGFERMYSPAGLDMEESGDGHRSGSEIDDYIRGLQSG